MARGPESAAPRFRPAPRGPSPLARLLPVAIVLGLVLVGSLAWGNRGRLSLRCTEGRLEAHRGTVIPWREVPLEDPIFVPLPVSEDRCIDATFGSRRALESAYLDAAVTSVDHAISSGSAQDVQRSLATLDLIIAAAEDPRRHRDAPDST